MSMDRQSRLGTACLGLVLALSPAAHAATTLFSSTFASSLGGLSVANPLASSYTVSNGIHGQTQNGDLWVLSNPTTLINSYQDFFYTPDNSASGNFQATLAYSNFSPTADYQQIVLLVWGDDNDFVRLSYVFNGGGLPGMALERAETIAGSPSGNTQVDTSVTTDSSGWLQMTKSGNSISFGYSTNGTVFNNDGLGSVTFSGPINRIGFMGVNVTGATYTVNSFTLIDTPEPTGAALLLGGLAGLGALCHRRSRPT